MPPTMIALSRCFVLLFATVGALEENVGDWNLRHQGSNCVDLRADCTDKADILNRHAVYMHHHCPVSCGTCQNRTLTVSTDVESPFSIKANKIFDAVGQEIGVPQRIIGTMTQKAQIAALVRESIDHVKKIIQSDDRYKTVQDQCRNKNAKCSYWAAVLDRCEDERYEDVMFDECAPACFWCEDLYFEPDCPYDPYTMPSAWYPGDVDRMFERIVRDYSDAYDLTVHSRPTFSPGDDEEKANYITGPWVITLDNFLSEEECEHLIELGHDAGFERSTGFVKMDESGNADDMVTDQRTSSNAWCDTERCNNDKIVNDIRDRMHNMVDIPRVNSEILQLLKYEPGQYYKMHHDYSPFERDQFQGPRILTIFMYLSNVEEGGGTNFPALDDLTVHPRAGRVLLWPSVRNDKPHDLDLRVLHEALPVVAGTKYAANVWIHQRDLQPISCWEALGWEKDNW